MRVYVHCNLGGNRFFRGLATILGAATPESRYATCPDCGGTHLKQLHKPDRIDRLSRLPWNRIQRLLGGRLYLCRPCRLQFYDCRKRDLVFPQGTSVRATGNRTSARA